MGLNNIASTAGKMGKIRILFLANTDWYLFNYRKSLAKHLISLGFDVILVSPPGKYSLLLEKEGIPFYPFAFERKSVNPLTELLTIARLIKLIKYLKPDIVHFFTIKAVLYGTIAAKICGVNKIINAITGLGYVFSDAPFFIKYIARVLYRISLQNTFIIFQNPEDIEEFLSYHLIKREQSHLIPGSGVDTDLFIPVEEPDGDPVILIACRLLKSKGVVEFAEAANRIHNLGIKAQFIIVGTVDPENPDSLNEKDIDQLKSQGDVEFLGWRDDMIEVIKRSSIICLPTRYKEGLPRLLLEAGASSRPVIASDIAGCRVVVQDGENGFLISPSDIEQLAEALIKLIKDQDLRRIMGAKGRKIVVEKFSVESINKQTLRVYNLLLENPSKNIA